MKTSEINQDFPHFDIGHEYNRQRDIHDKYGGNRQSGIAVCAKFPIIFLFESESGKESGYSNGQINGAACLYSGEGAKGDMQFIRGNKAILEHKGKGRNLYLFKKVNRGFYEFIGQFCYQSHQIIEGLDINHKKRKIILFTLVRI